MADQNIDINIGINATKTTEGGQKAKAAVSGVSKEAKELEAAFKRLKTSLDPTFAAQQKYNRLLEDNKKLLQAGVIARKEYNANIKAAKAVLEEEISALQRRTAAGKAALAQERSQKAAQAAADRQAAQEARQAARQKAQEEKQAAKEAAAAVRQAKREEREAVKQAAQEAKAAAREKAAAERAAAKEEEAAQRAAKKAEREAIKAAAAEAKQAAREKAAAARQAAKDAADAAAKTKAANAAAARAARDAANAAASHAKAEKQSAAAAHELRASIDPAYAAQSRYNETMRTATRLLMEGKLKQGEWNAIQRQARIQMEINARSLGRMNTAYTQLGFQVQDVFAQLSTHTNPFVIIAQQGSQAAMALSTVGGRIGKVASFISGPLGASILGLVALIGLVATKQKEAKEKTVDLTDATERHEASIYAVEKALRKYLQTRREANQANEEATRSELAQSRQLMSEAESKLATLRRDVQQKQAELNKLLQGGQAGSSLGAGAMVTRLKMELKSLQDQLKAAQDAFDTARKAVTENEMIVNQSAAEAAVDKTKEIERNHQLAVMNLNQAYRKQVDEIYKIQDVKKRQKALDEAEIARQAKLVELLRQKKAAEEAAAADKKDAKLGQGQSNASFIMPVNGPITSGMGPRTAPIKGASTNHGGIDIGASYGTRVQAPQVGVVEAVGYSSTLGKYVILNHGGGTKTRFGHLSDNSMVAKGQEVQQGQTIGRVGSTGTSTGPHLHYEVRVNGKLVDPRRGIFPVDELKAEQAGLKSLSKAAEDVLRDRVEAMDTKVSEAEAESDYNTAISWQEKKIAALKQFYGEHSREAERAAQELIQIEKRMWQQKLQVQKDAIQQQQKLDEDAEQTRFELEGQKNQTKSGNIDFKESNGLISAKQALQERAALLDQEFQQQIQHENRMYQIKVQTLRDIMALEHTTPQEKAKINAEIEIAEAQHQNNMKVLQGKYNQGVIQTQQQAMQLTMNKWRGMFDNLRTSVGGALQGLLTRTMSWKQAMLSVADSILFRFLDMGLQLAEDWAMKELFKTQATTAGEAARTAAATGGAAARAGVSSASAMTELTNEAAVSAAGAYKSTVVIPFIGPVAAPAAAALALAAVLGFASMISAKGGAGTIERDGQLAELHKDEMVLPSYLANPMRDMLTGVGPSRSGLGGRIASAASEVGGLAGMVGGDTHLHLSAIDTQSGIDFVMKNRRHIGKAIQKAAREGMKVRN